MGTRASCLRVHFADDETLLNPSSVTLHPGTEFDPRLLRCGWRASEEEALVVDRRQPGGLLLGSGVSKMYFRTMSRDVSKLTLYEGVAEQDKVAQRVNMLRRVGSRVC